MTEYFIAHYTLDNDFKHVIHCIAVENSKIIEQFSTHVLISIVDAMTLEELIKLGWVLQSISITQYKCMSKLLPYETEEIA